MKNYFCLGSLLLLAAPAFAAPQIATPDPAQVARYTQDTKARDAKLADCKKRDMATALGDTACMSADQALKMEQNKMLTSKCSSADTFVFVPATLKGKALEDYLRKKMPSEQVLKDCNTTGAKWLEGYMKKSAG